MKCLFLVLCLTSFAEGTLTSCNDGWLAYEGSCYFFGHDAMHFTEAEHYCRQRNSHLIYVNSKLENDFIKSRLEDFNLGVGSINHYKNIMQYFRNGHEGKYPYWWLGLTDEVTEGHWIWLGTDDTATFTDWSPGEPNGSSEDCAIFHNSYQYKWVDTSCMGMCIALCEASGGHESEIIG